MAACATAGSFKVDDRYISGLNGDDSGGRNYEDDPVGGRAVPPHAGGDLTPAPPAASRRRPSTSCSTRAAAGFNFGLDAATSTHYEAGLKAWVGNDSRLDVALFEIRTDKELVVDGALGGRTSYKNAGQTTRQGVEVALDSRWARNLSNRIAYTYLDARRRGLRDAHLQPGHQQRAERHRGAGPPPARVAAHSLFGELVWRHQAAASTPPSGRRPQRGVRGGQQHPAVGAGLRGRQPAGRHRSAWARCA